ncbi:hypothetical protein [Rickettsiales endosymbiont of Stachyamoeba lipophora]|uniref:hypothetical protein n=1 Tax=Rickettsiales endosymbiont of Stachyamoeba lipophora TaxID=2486578 RepID=UPI000F649A10|nr:hypothetical protein [Rickettsiales endosymbiont of Stachyamoeba lipophora]AZL15423.1 hypothetical protein EF513_02500 [Rickettsiales endosymbiont of Stachyamoeba lipophora]
MVSTKPTPQPKLVHAAFVSKKKISLTPQSAQILNQVMQNIGNNLNENDDRFDAKLKVEAVKFIYNHLNQNLPVKQTQYSKINLASLNKGQRFNIATSLLIFAYGNDLSERIEITPSEHKHTAQDIGNKVKNTTAELNNVGQKEIKDGTEKNTATIPTIKNKIDVASSDIKQDASPAKHGLKDKINVALGNISNAIKQAPNNVQTLASQVAFDAPKGANIIKTTLSNFRQNLNDHIVQPALTKLHEAKELIGKQATNLKIDIQYEIPYQKEQFSDKITGIKKDIKSNFTNLTEDLKLYAKKAKNNIGDKIELAQEEVAPKMKDAVRESIAGIYDATIALSGAAARTAKDASKYATTFGIDTIATAQETTNDIKNRTQEITQNIKTDVKQFAQTAKKTIKDLPSNTIVGGMEASIKSVEFAEKAVLGGLGALIQAANGIKQIEGLAENLKKISYKGKSKEGEAQAPGSGKDPATQQRQSSTKGMQNG